MSSLNVVKFCPDCNSIFSYDKNTESKLILKCKRCGYVDEHNVKMHFTKSSTKQTNIFKYSIPTEYSKYDDTILRSSLIVCPNSECPTIKGQLTDSTFPEVLLTNKASVDRLMTMTCIHCNVSWQ